jgi:hypothetical protein
MRRPLGVVLVVLGLLPSCASAPMTPAEERAWARWKQCDRFPAVRLDAIGPDGGISTTVRTAAMSGLEEAAAWKRCMDDAAAAQAALPATPRLVP